jgi:hypothetical protein
MAVSCVERLLPGDIAVTAADAALFALRADAACGCTLGLPKSLNKRNMRMEGMT